MRKPIARAAASLLLLSVAGCTAGGGPAPDHSASAKAVGATTVSNHSTPDREHQATFNQPHTGELTPTDLLARFQAYGLEAISTGPLPMPLFGAVAVEGMRIEGVAGTVYVFADRTAAAKALLTASNPQANTVSWAVDPSFFQVENLLLVLATRDGQLTSRIASAVQQKR